MRTALPLAVLLVAWNASPAVGQPPAPVDMVTLAPSGQSFDTACDVQVGTHLDTRIFADASRSPLIIPSGHVLVLTGGTWASQEFAGAVVALQIELRHASPSHVELVASAPGATGGTGFVVSAFTITPGLVVAPDVAVCTRIVTNTSVGAGPASTRLYGYFAKAPLHKVAPTAQ